MADPPGEIPRAIVRRAQEILEELESSGRMTLDRSQRRSAMRSEPSSNASFQLTMFGGADPVLDELKALDVESLSPLEAITKLFELQRKVKESGS